MRKWTLRFIVGGFHSRTLGTPMVAALAGVLFGIAGSGAASAQTPGAPCTINGQKGVYTSYTLPDGQSGVVCSPSSGSGGAVFVPDPFEPGHWMMLDPSNELWGPAYAPGATIQEAFFPIPLPAAAPLGGPVSLSMYGSDSANGLVGNASVFGVHNSGYAVTDSAGTLAAGTLAPGFRALDYGGGLKAVIDGSRAFALSSNQQLLFGLNFDYHHDQMDFGSSALTPGLSSAGSVARDIYTLAAGVKYIFDTFYVSGRASFDWSNAGITNNADGGTGNTTGDGYTLSAALGKVFPLINTTGASPAILTKAPLQSAGGYATFLDVSGHGGYLNDRDGAFTDTSGFVYGTEQVSFGDIGGKVKLIAVVPDSRFAWMPYVGVSVDQQFGFSHTFEIPAQAAAAADTYYFDQATTFWGVQAGLNIIDRGGVTAGVSAFYTASADTEIVGGNVFVKIPFYGDPHSAGDGGIREANK